MAQDPYKQEPETAVQSPAIHITLQIDLLSNPLKRSTSYADKLFSLHTTEDISMDPPPQAEHPALDAYINSDNSAAAI